MGMDMITLRLPQDTETLTSEAQHGRFAFRYAYARSADTRDAGLPGQDYLVVHTDGQRLAFALSDGVSQSFCGEIAARLVGDAVAGWLWHAPSSMDSAALAAGIAERLTALVTDAAPEVQAAPLPAGLAPVVRDVLEQKRALGTEANFAAGLVDTTANALALVWLGDLRLRLWHGGVEQTDTLGDTFHTRERWSSRRGVVGEVHAAVRPVEALGRLAVYSDGLAVLDSLAALTLDNEALDTLIAEASRQPASDDICALEIALVD